MEEVDSFQIWKRLVLMCNIKGRMTAREIAKLLNDSPHHPYFRQAIKFIEEGGFCEVEKARMPFVYKINQKLLSKQLINSDIFRLARKLMDAGGIFYVI
jgi:hypothetical protein